MSMPQKAPAPVQPVTAGWTGAGVLDVATAKSPKAKGTQRRKCVNFVKETTAVTRLNMAIEFRAEDMMTK